MKLKVLRSPLSSRLRPATTTTVCLLMIAVAAGSAAKGITPKDITPTKSQTVQTNQILREIDAKVQWALKGNEKLAGAMQEELRAIAANKAPLARRQAIAAYQSKYVKDYAGILQKSGVNLAAVASRLSGIYPAWRFQALPNHTLLATFRQSTAAVANHTSGPTVTTTDLQRAADFTDHKDLGCGALSGSNVSFTSTKINNDTFAAEVGGCTNTGDKTAKIAIPADAVSAHVDITAKLSAETFAVGVIGAAGSNAGACASLVVNNEGVGDCIFVSVFAPMLWAASAEESLDPSRIGADLQANKQYDASFSTSTFSVTAGVVAETNAASSVKEISGTVTIQR